MQLSAHRRNGAQHRSRQDVDPQPWPQSDAQPQCAAVAVRGSREAVMPAVCSRWPASPRTERRRRGPSDGPGRGRNSKATTPVSSRTQAAVPQAAPPSRPDGAGHPSPSTRRLRAGSARYGRAARGWQLVAGPGRFVRSDVAIVPGFPVITRTVGWVQRLVRSWVTKTIVLPGDRAGRAGYPATCDRIERERLVREQHPGVHGGAARAARCAITGAPELAARSCVRRKAWSTAAWRPPTCGAQPDRDVARHGSSALW
jgi:hypothetical protein